MNWLLVGVVVTATVVADVLQSRELKRHGKITNISAGTFASVFRRPLLLAAIGAMAVSFFAFMKLLQRADLSFAVPATAASYVIETVLAQYVLKERVDSRRWTGALLVGGGIALLAL
jgi:drug/metabolite transporter (DMT)-like permease